MIVDGLYYTKDHEWLKVEGDTGTLGISDHAQQALGEITYVELPETGKEVSAKTEIAVVESTKSASDVFSPVSGQVTEINDALGSEPEVINSDCYGQGWILKIKITNPQELDTLMDAQAYKKLLDEE